MYTDNSFFGNTPFFVTSSLQERKVEHIALLLHQISVYNHTINNVQTKYMTQHAIFERLSTNKVI